MAGKKEIRGIVFDVGGVLVDKFDNSGTTLFGYAGKKLGVAPKKIKLAVKGETGLLQQGKETSAEFWKRICAKLEIPCPKDKTLEKLLAKTYRHDTKVNRKTFAVVRKLKQKYCLGILSNTIKEHVEINKKRKIYKLFETVVQSCDTGWRKPQKEIYRLAAQRMRIPPENLLFIDDNKEFASGARGAGLNAIIFKSPQQLERSLKKLHLL